MKKTILITTEDFATSNYLDVNNCALAKALKREFPNSDISVSSTKFLIDGNEYPLIFPTSFRIMDRCELENQKPLEVTFYLKEN